MKSSLLSLVTPTNRLSVTNQSKKVENQESVQPIKKQKEDSKTEHQNLNDSESPSVAESKKSDELFDPGTIYHHNLLYITFRFIPLLLKCLTMMQ